MVGEAAGVDDTAAADEDEGDAELIEALGGGGGLGEVERVGCWGRFSTQHLIDDSEHETLSSTCNDYIFCKLTGAQIVFNVELYLFAQESGKDMDASSWTIFTLGCRCDGIE